MRLLLDWSLLAYNKWFRMKSPNYEAISDDELENFALLMVSEVYKYKCRFDPTDFVFALDARPPWRKAWYDAYYQKWIKFWKDLSKPQSWVISFDQQYHYAHFHTGTKTWTYKQVTKKDERFALLNQLQDTDMYMFFEYGKTPSNILSDYPGSPATVQETGDWVGIDKIIPGYKKSRESTAWGFDTPKDQFKENMMELANNLAPVLGARVVKTDWSEADDIAAVYGKQSTEPTVLVSSDQDWPQIMLTNNNVRIWDTYHGKWVINDKGSISFKLLCKILGGDKSDDIASISVDGRKPFARVAWEKDGTTVKRGKSTVTYAKKLLKETKDNYGEIHDTLLEIEDDQTYTRNVNLISFLSLPPEIIEEIEKNLGESEVGKPFDDCSKLEDFGIDIKTQKTIEQSCVLLRELDNTIDFTKAESIEAVNTQYITH